MGPLRYSNRKNLTRAYEEENDLNSEVPYLVAQPAPASNAEAGASTSNSNPYTPDPKVRVIETKVKQAARPISTG